MACATSFGASCTKAGWFGSPCLAHSLQRRAFAILGRAHDAKRHVPHTRDAIDLGVTWQDKQADIAFQHDDGLTDGLPHCTGDSKIRLPCRQRLEGSFRSAGS